MKKNSKSSSNNGDHHVLVDGYNVAHAWEETRGKMRGGDLDGAVDAITEILWGVHDGVGCRVTIVLEGRGANAEIIRPALDVTTYSLLYTPKGVPADALILELASKKRKGGAVTVASADGALVRMAEERGALGMSPRMLRDWADEGDARVREQVEKHNCKERRRWMEKE